MNRDPLGLGALLYGMRPVHALTAAAWAVGPLAEREFELAHAGCNLSTFCRNPLHPGPCKGWRKKLGVDAPGVLHALNKAQADKMASPEYKAKLAERRAKLAEAKSAGAKATAGVHSPLHAKKASAKHANVLLGNDETKASAKAEKVILNKAEIKKYSKIKDAQVNGIREKHGLTTDTGLEDRLAAALAADNTTGRDEKYRETIAVSAQSFGAQLAEKHCKKLDGDCDGKLYEGLRDKLTADAEHALLTGDDSELSKTLASYKAGGWSPAPKTEPTVMKDAELSGPEKHTVGGDSESFTEAEIIKPPTADAQKLTLKDAGLKHGDKVWLHTSNGGGGIDTGKNPKKPGDKPILVTVDVAKHGHYGGSKGTVVATLVDENGHEVNGGSQAAKYWISPVGGGKFKPDSAQADETPAGAAEPPSFNEEKAADLFGSTDAGQHDKEQAKKLAFLQSLPKEDYDKLPATEKLNIDNFVALQVDKWGKSKGTLSKTVASIQQELGLDHGDPGTPTPVGMPIIPPKKPLKDLLNMDDIGASHGEIVEAVQAVPQADFDKLSNTEKAIGAQILGEAKAMKLPGADAAVTRWATLNNSGVPLKPLNAKQKKAIELHTDNMTSDEQAIDGYGALSKEEFDGLSEKDKKAILGDLTAMKNLAAGDEGDQVAEQAEIILNKLDPPATLSKVITPDAQKAADLATGKSSATAKGKLAAYEVVSGEEFQALPPDTQKLILADLLAVKNKFNDPKKKHQAQAHHDYLSKHMGGGSGAGGGGNPGADAVTLTAEQKHDNAMNSVATLAQAVAIPGSPLADGDPGAIQVMQSSFNDAITDAGHDKAAAMIAPAWTDNALGRLAALHKDVGLDLDTLKAARPALVADIEKSLAGAGDGDTPHLQALLRALKTGKAHDAADFMEAAVAASPAPAASLSPSASPSDLGTYDPSDSIGYGQAVGSYKGTDGILFSAFKSGHKGSVLSHSTQDIYENLLAVAQHYKGTSPSSESGFGGSEIPDTLSVLQVAKAVDVKLSQAKGVKNENVLQSKIYQWSQTPEGKKYIAEHPIAGAKWTDNLSGHGAGSAQAAKIGLVNGAPVGKRAQAAIPSKNGKAPKFDPNKSSDDFQPLMAPQMSLSQSDYMDSGEGRSWTPGEAESLANYTTGAYYELNAYLRGKDANGGPVDTISDLGLERIALNQAGMRPLQQDTLLKRGTGFEFVPEEFRDPTKLQKLIGKTVTDPGFMSTTIAGESGNFHKAVLMEIEAPEGTPAAWVKQISHNPGENEVVLAAGTRYRVVSVTPGDMINDYSGHNPTIVRVRVVA